MDGRQRSRWLGPGGDALMADSIRLVDAAQYFNFEQHQIDAFDWLEEEMGPELNAEFAKRYRTKPEGISPNKISQLGLDLITHFEGCKLYTYICPAGKKTCCVGHTGPEVEMGQTYTQSECDALLAADVKRFEEAVQVLINVPIDQCEFDSLTSFAFNVGEGALQDSTLRRRLNAGEPKAKVFSEELPRWTNNGLAGLVRRRDAEVRLANEKQFP